MTTQKKAENRIHIRVPLEIKHRLDTACESAGVDKTTLLTELIEMGSDYVERMGGKWYPARLEIVPPPGYVVEKPAAYGKPKK